MGVAGRLVVIAVVAGAPLGGARAAVYGNANLSPSVSIRRLQMQRQGSLLLSAARLSRTGISRKLKLTGRASASTRVQSLLNDAAHEAAFRPNRAFRLVRKAERLGARKNVSVDRDLTREIELTAAHFVGQPLPALKVAKQAQPRLQPHELRNLVDYAHEYARLQREYNGARPEERLSTHPEFASKVTGRVPYWDLARDTAGLEIVGLADESPFLTETGHVRVFAHYLNEGDQARLQKDFGPPTGHMEAEMTSSYRTLIVYPKDGVPFLLKLSGHEASPWGKTKAMNDQQVESSVEKSLRLSKEDFIIPEPAGLILHDQQVHAIYRPLPLPREGVQPGDRLITWQVLMSDEFKETPEGKAIFARYGSPHEWFRKEAAPQLAAILYKSFFEEFGHFELHSQNVDALFTSRGELRKILVKDLLDVLQDPAGEAITQGRRPDATTVLRAPQWGDLGGAAKVYEEYEDLGAFYHSFLGQLGIENRSWRRADAESAEMIKHELLKLVAARMPLVQLARYPEFSEVYGPTKEGPYVALEKLRALVLKAKLTEGFRQDAFARNLLLAGQGEVVSASKSMARQFDADDPALEYGYIGQVPVAVKRQNGIVNEYYFRFP